MSILFRLITTFFIAAVLSAFFPAAVLAGQGIVVVQSFRVKPYNEALKGFKAACGGEISRIVVTESGESPVAAIRKEKPALVVAIGMDALAKVREIRDVPVVYVMVLNPKNIVDDLPNFTGVSMNISPEKQLAALQKVLPQARKVGVLYNPAKTGPFVKKAAAVAKELGIELVTREVRDPREIPTALSGIRNSINAFWIIPDTTVVTPETAEYILLFSHRNGIPVQAVSEKYVEMGALSAVTLDAHAMGRQAGEMARRILAGAAADQIPRIDAAATVLAINLKVAKKLGISISSEALTSARIIQ